MITTFGQLKPDDKFIGVPVEEDESKLDVGEYVQSYYEVKMKIRPLPPNLSNAVGLVFGEFVFINDGTPVVKVAIGRL